MKTTDRLDQLTSLRFFAALMIVIHHADGAFGLGPVGVHLGQAVSFFFVLSGFILAHVYPSLDTRQEIHRFWLARVARILPVYLVTLLIAFTLQGLDWTPATGIPHLLLLQAWVPVSAMYFSYNAVAWSISTEAFFYLAFPWLIRNWARTWPAKLVFAVLLLLAILAAAAWPMPEYASPHTADGGTKLSVHGLIAINPLARLLEFVSGMVVARFWRASPGAPGAQATLVEAGAVALCALGTYATPQIRESLRGPLGAGGVMWMWQSGSLMFFAALIHVMARGEGAISRFLRCRPLVVLGEISFAMYLLHTSIYALWRSHAGELAAMPRIASALLFLCVLLGGSWLLWRVVEVPARRVILGLGRPASAPSAPPLGVPHR